MRRTAGVLSAALVSLAALSASSQETGGLTANITVSENLRYSDTRGQDRLSAVTRLGFSLASRTRSEALVFDVSSGLDFTVTGEDGLEESESDFFEPRLSLSYTRANRSSEISASAAYRREEIFGFIPEQGFIAVELIPATGLREDTDANLGFTFGKDAPFGGTLSYSLRDRTYSDVIDAGIFDTRRETLSADLNFRLTGRVTANVLVRRETYVADDLVETDRIDDRVAVGVDLQVSPVLSVSADLDYDRRETESLLGTTVTEGAGLNLSASLDRPNGALTGSLSSNITPSGQRTTLRFGRSYTLREDATFSFSLGATKTEDLPLSLLAGLTFERDLERGSVTVSLDQQAETDINDRQIISTQLSASIARPINSRQGFGASVSLANTNVLDEDAEADRTRADLSLTYDYALGAQWGLNAGVTHTRFFGEDIDDDARNSVFVGVSRSFAYRP